MASLTRAELRALARQQAWRDGWASDYLLDAGQRKWLAAFRASEGASVWMIGRQRGKSFAALTLACEECIRHPGFIVRYAALTGKSAKAIVLPTLAQVLKDCPPDVRPVVKEQDGTVVFPNGSSITYAGTDNEQFDRLRGPRAHLVLADESAFYADLERVESALLPQLTTTAGRALYLSTPPESSGHRFVDRWRAAMASGNNQHATIHDNPRLGADGVDRIMRTEAQRLGLTEENLVKSTFWRREYLAEIVTDESRAAIPAWTQELAAEVVGDWQRPEHFDAYEAHDAGVSGDPHASLFAWHDPQRNEVVIEDEIEMRSVVTTIRAWSDEVKRRESALYGVNAWNGTVLGAREAQEQLRDMPEFLRGRISDSAPRQPYLRVGDNAQGVCKEMTLEHGLWMLPTDKHDKAFHVDAANHLIATKRVRIHKRCTRLIEQLYSTVWNKSRSEWERTDKDHGDLIDCLVYLLRNVRWHRDCRPKHVDSAQRAVAEIQERARAQGNGWREFRRR